MNNGTEISHELPLHSQEEGSRPDPVVSVIIPCYNAWPFLAEAIDSALGQTYPRSAALGCNPTTEVIVVDDGSTDQSMEVLNAYGERIRPVRLRQNRGGSHARNVGAGLATGTFLMFLDADDVIAPDALDSLLDAVREHPRTLAVGDWSRLRRVDGAWVTVSRNIPLPHEEEDPVREWLKGRWVPPCAVLWRHDAYDLTGGWDEEITFNDDGDLMYRAFCRGVRMKVAEQARSYYRDHGAVRLTVGTDMGSVAKLESGVRVLEKLRAELEQLGTFSSYELAVGSAYKTLALYGFQHRHVELARQCLAIGESMAGRKAVSPTLSGRMLERLAGLERKEKLASFLASRGVMTRGRALVVQRLKRVSRTPASPDG